MPINYLVGDATYPKHPSGPKIIAHISNNCGGWGAGFVLAISARWPQPETVYRSLRPDQLELGLVQFVEVESDDHGEPRLIVANMIAQEGYGRGNRNLHRTAEPDTRHPIRYNAVEICLQKVGALARELGATVHMPRIGCGLAGGKWDQVEPIIARTLLDTHVFVYDLPPR